MARTKKPNYKSDLDVLKKYEQECECGFYIRLPDGTGYLDAEQLYFYYREPIKFLEQWYRCSIRYIDEYRRSNGWIHCRAITKAGHQCKNRVTWVGNVFEYYDCIHNDEDFCHIHRKR